MADLTAGLGSTQKAERILTAFSDDFKLGFKGK
jgi:hypothetical protein